MFLDFLRFSFVFINYSDFHRLSQIFLYFSYTFYDFLRTDIGLIPTAGLKPTVGSAGTYPW